jgi:hypothetical protein
MVKTITPAQTKAASSTSVISIPLLLSTIGYFKYPTISPAYVHYNRMDNKHTPLKKAKTRQGSSNSPGILNGGAHFPDAVCISRYRPKRKSTTGTKFMEVPDDPE